MTTETVSTPTAGGVESLTIDERKEICRLGPKHPLYEPLRLYLDRLAWARCKEAENAIPTAKDYRVEEIVEGVCMARTTDETPEYKDKRWTPAVYRERQCGGKTVDGHDLCKKCLTKYNKYLQNPVAGRWVKFITEEPPGWMHMLGTDWAEFRQPKFNPDA